MVNEPQVKTGGGGGRLLGVRESNQALAELKTKLEFALSRLNDQDTQRTGIEEIREFLQTLYPDWFPMVISCIGEAGTNLKPLGRCESVKLLGLLAELHGDSVVPLLTRILQVVVTRLQDADLHLREACAETVFRLTRALVLDEESSGVFATLLKPLFGALGEHSKWVQIGAAACICSVIQGSPPPVVRDNLGRLCSRLVQHLSLPLAMARPQLLGACIYAMDAVRGTDFDEVLPSLMPCLESCLNASSDWQTRKQAIEVLQTIGDNPELGQSLELAPPSNTSVAGPTPLQRRIALLLEVVRTDKVRAVREAVKDVMLRWSITKVPVLGASYTATNRSSSPTNSKMWEAEALQRGERPGVPARSSSPTVGAYRHHAPDTEREVQRMQGDASQQSPSMGGSMGGSSGVRSNRSIRAGMRERPEARDEEVTVLVPPERPRASEGGIAAAEKAAAADEKARAIKAALSGAALHSTKKPRPKRERQSIFSGPTNTSFFMGMSGTPTGGTQTISSTMSSGMDDLGEDIDGPEESPEAQEYSVSLEEEDANLAREMRAAQLRAKRVAPMRDYTPSSNTGRSGAGSEADRLANWSDELVPEPATGRPPEDHTEALTYSDDEVDTRATDTAMHLDDTDRSSHPSIEIPTYIESGGTGSVRRAPPARRQRVDHGGSAVARMQASKEPSPETSHIDVTNGDISFQERLLARLESLERTCADQAEALASQAQHLELAERRLQLQEQQSRQQDQRIQQQEQQLLQQEKRLHDQELQMQQQEQQCEEQQLVLREHEQQMEQQEQMLDQHKALICELMAASASWNSRGPGARTEDQVVRTLPAEGSSRSHAEAWSNTTSMVTAQGPPEALGPVPSSGASELQPPQRPLAPTALREGLLQVPSLDSDITIGSGPSGQVAAKNSHFKKASGPLWDKVLALCEEQRYLEAYKQVIAEPEETCLLRLMQHTGPIVERLDAESNSRLIRRLIHILSSPGKEPASSCIEQVFSWLWQALDVGIHFTSSQVEDLAAALQKASAPASFKDREEAQQLLARVSALRRS